VQWQLATSQLCRLGEGLCHTHVRIVADPRPDDIGHMGDMGSRWAKPRWTKPHDRCAIAHARRLVAIVPIGAVAKAAGALNGFFIAGEDSANDAHSLRSRKLSAHSIRRRR
jgi:hypothetical protein